MRCAKIQVERYRPLFSLLLFSLAKSLTRLEELRDERNLRPKIGSPTPPNCPLASASVAVPAASQLKTYFDIATSLQGCSDEIALTFMGSVTSHSFVISTFQGTL